MSETHNCNYLQMTKNCFLTEKETTQNVIVFNNSQYPYETTYDQITIKQLNYSKKEDYLGFSIFNMLCCVCCLGLPAIIFSVKAREQYRSGRFELAQDNADTAKKLNITGIIIGSIIKMIIPPSSFHKIWTKFFFNRL